MIRCVRLCKSDECHIRWRSCGNAPLSFFASLRLRVKIWRENFPALIPDDSKGRGSEVDHAAGAVKRLGRPPIQGIALDRIGAKYSLG